MRPYKQERTVLVCDDDLEVRSYLEIAIKSLGYAVQSARDGDELLSLLQDSEAGFFAVLLDMVMPNLGGAAVLREIRGMDAKPPVIIISGSSSIEDAVGAMRNGAMDFVSKPVTHDDLERVLNAVRETRHPVCRSAPRTINTPKAF